MTPLEDQVAVITGAGNGIGRAVAELLAASGAKLVVNDLGTAPDGSGSDANVAERTAEDLRSRGARAVACAEDVATAQGAERVMETATTEYGRLDVLICCAGFFRDGLLLKVDEEAFDAVFNVHVRGTFLCVRAAAERMKKDARGGRIVTTTGIAGFTGMYAQASYSAAAAAVYALTRTASIELQRYGIRVNAVAPIAKTRLTEKLPMFDQVDSMRAEHVAPAYLFFASPASGDLSGTVLAAAGGKLSAYRMAESIGKLKEASGGLWTVEEIETHWDAINRG